MKNGNLPKMGPRGKVPSDEQLMRLDMMTIVIPAARKILKKCKAPKSWGENEIRLIIKCVALPGDFDAITVRKFPNKMLNAHRTNNALNLGKMFAESPNAIIDSLPKIRDLLKRAQGVPRSQKIRTKTLVNAVIESYVVENVFDRQFRLQDAKRFWNVEAKVIAEEYKERLNLKVTERTIEDAKAAIRDAMSVREFLDKM